MTQINQSPEEQTLEPTSEPTQTAEITENTNSDPIDPVEKPEKSSYHNRTAKLMNTLSVLMLVFTVIFFGFQIYMMVIAGLQQGFMLSLLYNAPSLMLFLLLFLGAFGLFRFFAEVLELMDRKHS